MLKYKLRTDLTINYNGTILYRIEALKDFGNVKKGDIGGYIEKEENLSHNNNAWVYGDALVFGFSKVTLGEINSGYHQYLGNKTLEYLYADF